MEFVSLSINAGDVIPTGAGSRSPQSWVLAMGTFFAAVVVRVASRNLQ